MKMAPAPSREPQRDDDTPRFQFGLRTLFVAVTGVALFFGVAGAIGPAWSLALAWFLILAGGHMAASARGTRLRQQATAERCPPVQSFETPHATATAGHRCDATRLGLRSAISYRPYLASLAGGAAGGTIGTALLLAVYWPQVGLAAIGIGGISTAALGGWLGFLTGSFLEVAGGALREAAVPERRLGAAGGSPRT